MNSSFFYSISVNDRVRFPLLGELKKEAVPSDVVNVPMDVDTTFLDEEFNKDVLTAPSKPQRKEGDSYFETFKQTNEKGLYCDEILNILEGFFNRLRTGSRNPWRSLSSFLDSFSTYFHNHPNEFRELMDIMNIKRLITPYIELDLPVSIIEEFNQLEQDDPRIQLYQLNPVWGPAIKEFGFFLERYESTKEVLCLFIWSTIDQAVVPMPAVGLNPYPLCWVCDKGFGTLACNRCQVAKYCSKDCLQKDCIRHGGPVCDLMSSCLRRVKKLTFKRPPSPPSSPVPTPTPPLSSKSSKSSSTSSSSSTTTTTKTTTTTTTKNNSDNNNKHGKARSKKGKSFNPSNKSSNCSISSSSTPSTSPMDSLSPSPSSSPPPSPPSVPISSSDSDSDSETDPPFTHVEFI